jgi:hypothetical protein
VTTFLLIVHGLVAVALLGAISHQAASVLLPGPAGANIATRFRAVPGGHYTDAIIVLFVVNLVLGALIYPSYRLNVRTYLQDYHLFSAEGSFEMKEHLAAIGLVLLPLYRYVWKNPIGTQLYARLATTSLLALVIWTSFLVGHVLNNIRGLFGT